MDHFLYLCDGEVPECAESFTCYRRGGPCRHVSDICHRVAGRPPVCMDLFEASPSSSDDDDTLYFEIGN